jgi:poly-gamma-glutamate synthesis protein (capsule biosynthesis protein)
MKRRRIKKGAVILALLILISLLVGSLYLFKNIFTKSEEETPVELDKNEEEKVKIKSLSLVMVGDVLIHSSLYTDAKAANNTYDFAYMFENVKPLFDNYDLKFYNQESIIGGKALGLSSYPRFNSPEEIGDTMVDMGFNLVALANNHTLDKGEQGVINSSNYWKTKSNVITAGSYASEEDRLKDPIGEKNGIKYALLSYTTVTNGLKAPAGKEYLSNVYNEEKVKSDIERIKDKVDIILVSMHWGVEYTNTPNTEQKTIAKYLASLGVDIVIGHHPHVIQPVELIDNTLVFYSLGNFISGQDTNDRLTGMVASLDITVTEENGVKTKQISNVNAELVYTYHQRFSNYKLYPYTALTTNIFPSYQSYYDKYVNIITSLNDSITVTKIGE